MYSPKKILIIGDNMSMTAACLNVQNEYELLMSNVQCTCFDTGASGLQSKLCQMIRSECTCGTKQITSSKDVKRNDNVLLTFGCNWYHLLIFVILKMTPFQGKCVKS